MNKKTIRDVDLSGKRVLVRVDFNVPIEDGQITDDTRIRAEIPNLKAILAQNPRSVILMSHLGRPKGGPDPKYSLAPVVPELSKQLGVPVAFSPATVGAEAEAAVNSLPQGGVLLLENTRFFPGEEKNDPDLAKQLAALGDIFVNDAFGSAHRAHSSTAGVTGYLPAVAGLLMEKEINYLASAIEKPVRPFAAILGGAKVSDKIAVIDALLDKVDVLIIGGGMANTFLKAQGIDVGASLAEDDKLDIARDLLKKGGDKLVLPVDVVLGDKFADDSATQVVDVGAPIPDDWKIYDIGPESIMRFTEKLKPCKTVVWNGPMGVFEKTPFAEGTNAIARVLTELSDAGATTIVGGGDSAAAVEQSGLADKITHISTGGGASLEMLEGKALPGVDVLQNK
ncbi:MAG: phosphoglycerate kinase [Anaerolineae bacterium]|nr:phosphoglycerate kinase [Anaerolineae bacterium]